MGKSSIVGRYLGVAIVSMLMLGLAVPALASASEAFWLEEREPITEPLAIGLKGTVELEGRVSVGGSSYPLDVYCEDTGSGTAEPSGAGKVEKWTFAKCINRSESLCETPVSVEAVNVPWTTQLYASGEKIYQELPGKGEKWEKLGPELKVKCVDALNPSITMTNYCVLGKYSTYTGLLSEMTNKLNGSQGYVRAEAWPSPQEVECEGSTFFYHAKLWSEQNVELTAEERSLSVSNEP